MIGTLNESPLHASIKLHYARPGSRQEVSLEGFVIDLVQPDGELVEIQTGGFKPLRPKLERLLDYHRMRIVHPIAVERVLVRPGSSRRSPKKQQIWHLFERLVSFPTLITHPNFTLDALLIREEKRYPEGSRHLLEVVDRRVFTRAQDLAELLPGLDSFSTRSLAQALGCPRHLAQCLVYCLRSLELISAAGKDGRSPLYIKNGGSGADCGAILRPRPGSKSTD